MMDVDPEPTCAAREPTRPIPLVESTPLSDRWSPATASRFTARRDDPSVAGESPPRLRGDARTVVELAGLVAPSFTRFHVNHHLEPPRNRSRPGGRVGEEGFADRYESIRSRVRSRGNASLVRHASCHLDRLHHDGGLLGTKLGDETDHARLELVTAKEPLGGGRRGIDHLFMLAREDLDLRRRGVARELKERRLVPGRRGARHGPHLGVADLAPSESGVQEWKGTESPSDANLLAGRAGTEPDAPAQPVSARARALLGPSPELVEPADASKPLVLEDIGRCRHLGDPRLERRNLTTPLGGLACRLVESRPHTQLLDSRPGDA